MRAQLLFTFVILLFQQAIYAQPANDDCDGIVDLGVAPFCDVTQLYNNIGATASDIGEGNIPSCFYEDQLNDVWFKFTAADNIVNYDILVKGVNSDGANSIINPEIAVYRGELCAQNELGALVCATSFASGSVSEVSLTNLELTPGAEYFVRVSSFATNALSTQGVFYLCVTEPVVPYDITETGSTACSGELYDSGGADGVYSANEDNEFTICPDAPSGCIDFELLFYNLGDWGDNGSDQMYFYDGENSSAPVISRIGVPLNDNDAFEPAGGGGVCYHVKARSGCLTVRFKSNDEDQYEGFHAKWQCSAEPCEEEKPIAITDNISDEELLNKIARGNMTIDIDTIKCLGEQYAIFDRNGSSFPMDQGLLLTTGRASNAVGPNDNIDWELQNLGQPGDADLDTLIGAEDDDIFSITTLDACVVELDVFVPTDELHFDYIFASEEYAEFVNGFNDVFALLISGPGIEGDPRINNQENIAIIPNNGEEVSINTVNHLINWRHYINLETSTLDLQHFNAPIEYDGMTVGLNGEQKYLTAKRKVTPCQSYHLKFVVADNSDDIFDSGVFIADIRAGSPSLSVQYSSGFEYLAEQCTPAPELIAISIPEPSDEAQTFDLRLSGTATLNSDYLLDLPSSITFQPGQTSFQFPITVLTDTEMEADESIIIDLYKDYGCGEHTLSQLVIEIRDAIDVSIDVAQDSITLCQGETVNLQAMGAEQYSWTSDLIETSTESAISFEPTASGWVYVEGVVSRCMDQDSVYIDLRDISLEITEGDTLTICPGGSTLINVTSNPAGLTTMWENTTNLTVISNSQVEVSPNEDQLYTVTLVDANCTIKDSVLVHVSTEPVIPISASTQTSTFCQGDTIVLSSDAPDPSIYPSVSYSWSGASNIISDLNQREITVEVENDQTFTRVTTYGDCTVTDEFEVIIAQPYTVSIEEVALICQGEEVTLTATASQDNISFVWNDATGGVVSENSTALVQPDATQTYTLTTVDEANCYTLSNTITVEVQNAYSINELTIQNSNGNVLDINNIPKGQQLNLLVSTDPALSNATYEWYMDGELIRTTSNPTSGLFDIKDFDGELDIVFSVTINANDCVAEETITAHVIDNLDVYVPTAFTPDQDGRNDRFRLLSNDTAIQISEFKIYNRWGQIVYDNENGLNGWDGTFNGSPAPVGVYAYQVTYVGSGNVQPVKLHGEVTLLR